MKNLMILYRNKVVSCKCLIANLMLLFCLSGCNDFLDVYPRETMKDNVLYSSQDGFRYALTGVYEMLADGSLYGQNTSMCLPEYLVRHWTIPVTDKTANIYVVSNYDFSNNKGNKLIEPVWLAYYKAIAQLNDILAHLETTDLKFSNNIDRLIKAEAIGLRGFLHLEILRYWGPVPSLATGDTKTIPYVTEFTNDASKTTSSTWQEVIAGIQSDLDEAESLLADIDPIKKFSPSTLNSGANDPNLEDRWLYYRQNRFNYYAVVATKARFYNWIATNSESSDEAKPLAIQYAKQVVEAINAVTEITQFTLVNRATIETNGLILTSECIFAIHNPKLASIVLPLFESSEPTLTQTTDNLNIAYESSLNAQDMRYGSIADGRYWIESNDLSAGQVNHFRKYSDKKEQVPLIRLPEMYFILMENLPLAEAVPYFRTFRQYRSMASSLNTSLTDEGALKDRLEKEYRKEFYGEGQMFFFYKRFKYTSFPYPDGFVLPQGLDSYKIPLPESQAKFGE